jgi:hypothetical protein
MVYLEIMPLCSTISLLYFVLLLNTAYDYLSSDFNSLVFYLTFPSTNNYKLVLSVIENLSLNQNGITKVKQQVCFFHFLTWLS